MSEPSESVTSEPAATGPGIERRLLLVLAGVVAGLLLAEGACWWRDGGAFPHLHVYQAGGARGVRLRPGDHQRHARPGGRPTDVRINAQGYRGDDFPAPGPGQVVVVGDSQVFGLGVEQAETVSARLAARLPGVTVLGAGVPSYGPNEYAAMARELLAGREGATLVVVFDLATDVLELDSTVAERAIVVGGWLVDARSAARVRRLPGDEALRGSHLLQALRRLDRPVERVDAAPPVAESALARLASRTRGSYEAGVIDGWGPFRKQKRVDQARQEALAAFRQAEALIVAEPAFASLLARERTAQEQALYRDHLISQNCSCGCSERQFSVAPDDRFEQSLPGGRSFDGGRGPEYRPRLVSSLLSPAVERAVRARAAASAGDPPALARSLAAITAALDHRDALARAAHAVSGRPWPELDPVRSVFFGALGELAGVAAEHGATLVVTALPLPQQVGPGPSSRRFYTPGQTDLELAEVAGADLLATAVTHGARAADARSLAAVPGARLADGHLAPAGHEALAGVLAGAVRPGGAAGP